MLLGVKARQAHEPTGVVAGVDHLGPHLDGAAIGGRVHVDLGDVEAKCVQPSDAALESVQL